MSGVPIDLQYEEDDEPALIVLGFDPGVTTGWAVARVPREALITQGFSEAVWRPGFGLASGQIGGLNENDACDVMVGVTRTAYSFGDYSMDRFAIAMEDFILQRLEKDRSLLSPVRMFAKYEYAMAKLTGASSLVLPYFKQSANDAKHTITDERLARWNLLKPGQIHARDATRHAIMLARRYSSQMHVRSKVDSAY